MSSVQMAQRCPGAVAVGPAVLVGYRIVFPRRCTQWRGAVAGLTSDAEAFVEGVLWSVREDHLAALDEYEGIDEGDYTRDRIKVSRSGGSAAEAWTYFAVTESGGPFRPTSAYLATMVTGAREHRLSVKWIDMLVVLGG